MILITGATRGIGKYLFDAFLGKDYNVRGTYSNTLPASHYDKYTKKLLSPVDITIPRDVEHWIANIKNKQFLTLINCAGINYTSFAHKADIELWHEVIEVNLMGTFNVIRYILPYMRRQVYGRIINFSSIVAQLPTPGTSAYAASKAGLWGMTKSLASENASFNITINNLNLGYFNIGMIIEVGLEFQEKLKKEIPTHEFGKPSDILQTVIYLIEMEYINGTSIDINGGKF